MVDQERVERLLDRLARDAAGLRALTRRDLLHDETALRAAKYDLVVLAEGAVRVAHHLVLSQGWPVAETGGEALRRLAAEGVVPPALAERLARAVGLRNLLVHRYDDVDDTRVVTELRDVSAFDDFAAHVAAWLPTAR
ncbi:type VII toxin-antitoxin system HepT family RNase toxin [Aquipuribacter sp. SD81]|uniref:type VII toxin-antitoxin system HepT family RNase toxin n=1 Tax=Aquipuribacter sp. SD81 TaxID=3127703 RepID=UPI0030196739